jgi:nucleotide-binding universal stress UspA family protein
MSNTGESPRIAGGLLRGNYAKEKAIDLIVVGVEKRSKTQKILLGSTAQFIILKAPCPVLTVK